MINHTFLFLACEDMVTSYSRTILDEEIMHKGMKIFVLEN